MYTLILIKYILLLLLSVYFSGLLIVWIYEFKAAKAYKVLQRKMRLLETLRISSAVLHAKMFMAEQDYLKIASSIDLKQKFILENVLFVRRRSSFKIMP
jgi:hypothetical protein